jgi:hypothetical protein
MIFEWKHGLIWIQFDLVSYFPRIKNAIFFEFILTAEPTSSICPLQYLADSI